MRRVRHVSAEPFDKAYRVGRDYGVVFQMQVEAGAALHEHVLQEASRVFGDAKCSDQ